MELATVLIWTLRIVLPIILFCIYFKLQSPKEESWPGPSNNKHTRGAMLVRRKPVMALPPPPAFANLSLAGPERAPALFTAPTRSGTTRERGGRERGKGKGRGGDDEDGRPRERRERPQPRDRAGEKGEGSAGSRSEAPAEAAAPVIAVPEVSPSEERMHLESLLNYVAFNRKEQQRTFILDEAAPPPPPPPPGKKPPVPKSAIAPEAPCADAEAAPTTGGTAVTEPVGIVAGRASKGDEANAEAQMVLSGLIKLRKGADVANNLYEQLCNSELEISERTFALMIEACVIACDLKSSSNFLMKMEAAGHCPDTELLDKVMDLYSQQKTARESGKFASNDGNLSFKPDGADASSKELISRQMDEALATACANRAKLSSGAPLFVPFGAGAGTAMQPPPPPGPRPVAAAEENKSAARDLTAEEAYLIEQQRTALKASAQPFQPQGTVTFDPYQYTWTVDTVKQAKQDKEAKGKKGTDKGKGGSKGKAKTDGKGIDQEAKKAKPKVSKPVEKKKEEKVAHKSTGAMKWQEKK